MSKFSLSELASIFAEKNGMSQTDAEAFIKQMFEVAHRAIQRDKQLKIKWLGTFKITTVKDRESIDVNTGERIVIEGRDKMTFSPDAVLKDIVNKPFAQFETVVVNEGVDFSSIDRKFAQMGDEGLAEDKELAEDKVLLNDKEQVEEIVELQVQTEPADVTDAEPEVQMPVVEQTTDAEEFEKEEVKEETSVASTESLLSSAEPSVPNTTPSESSAVPSQLDADSHIEENVIEPSVAEAEVTQDTAEEKVEEKEDAHEDNLSKHYFLLPRYALPVALVILLCLMGGIGWFAFSYGQLEAQRNHLSLQLADLTKKQNKRTLKKVTHVQPASAMALKAKQDSIRMSKASEAIDKVSQQELSHQTKGDTVAKAKVSPKDISSKKDGTESSKHIAKYDEDVRVRTGAYRITGISQTVEAKKGQTLESLSKFYLGPGMECYMEAVNGSKELKPGQKVKIPKLELKKKKQ